MSSPQHVFLIGPGCVGKSTVGPLVAKLLNSLFVDLDREVIDRVGPIPTIIEDRGYEGYCRLNSYVAEQLIKGFQDRTVMATSSGFLAHDDQPRIVEKNQELIHRMGTSILLLPNEDNKTSADCIAARQTERYPDVELEQCRSQALTRLAIYRRVADVEVICHGTLPEVALAIVHEYLADTSRF